jgi:engulfment and cell motility protein 1
MWSESGSASGDFTRVVALVRSQYVSCSVTFWLEVDGGIRIKVALRSENVRAWHEVEHDFNEEYRIVRDRQMMELELEDDLLSKVPVRWVTLTLGFRYI